MSDRKKKVAWDNNLTERKNSCESYNHDHNRILIRKRSERMYQVRRCIMCVFEYWVTEELLCSMWRLWVLISESYKCASECFLILTLRRWSSHWGVANMLKEAIADRWGGEVARSAKLLVSKSHILDSHPKKKHLTSVTSSFALEKGKSEQQDSALICATNKER